VPVRTISASQLQEFSTCRRRWGYSALEHLDSRRQSYALWFGIGVHHALDRFYSLGFDPSVSFDTWWSTETTKQQAGQRSLLGERDIEQKWLELRQLGIGMLSHYREWARLQDDFEVLATEADFRVPIPETEGHLVGRFDGIIRLWRRPNDVYLLEHKSYSIKPPQYFLLLDEQTNVYQWAATKLLASGDLAQYGVPETATVKGVLYNGLRKAVPTTPPLADDGKSLLRDARIATTYELYLASIREHDFSPSDYADVLVKLKLRGNRYFYREWIQRSAEELTRLERRLTSQFRAMSNPEVALLPSPTWDCYWRCPYFSLCVAENTGKDYDEIKRTQYAPRVWSREKTPSTTDDFL